MHYLNTVTDFQNESPPAAKTEDIIAVQPESDPEPASTAPLRPVQRRKLVVTGTVQGVGFRPFVFRLAHELKLSGQVQNTPDGVEILVQGREDQLQDFSRGLIEDCPPVARIASLSEASLPVDPGLQSFTIVPSARGQGHNVLISPDIATCEACLRDINDPDNPRFQYPFTNCTNCGPRYTITTSIPYDRAATSMACFAMCPHCSREYGDPFNRRFHAQPNACPVCGPGVWLTDAEGVWVSSDQEALNQVAEDLSQGLIVAVKGLGGFHLACKATDDRVVETLRSRKKRWGKPLAVMVPDLDTARRLGQISDQAAAWLSGSIRPIVLVPRRAHAPLAQTIAPDTTSIGLMLPYTPLHDILFSLYRNHLEDQEVPALVMTSGNFSTEPISLGNREALARLPAIADRFLFHNRDILIRSDDSVVRPLPDRDQTLLYRRARGFTPAPVNLDRPGPCVLGLGPELKATVCLTKNSQAFPSQHIGDLQNLETFHFYRETIEHLKTILQVEPELLVADLHPDFMSTRHGTDQDELPVLRLQHHFAHVHAVLAENRHQGPCLGLTLDGTGLGLDGTVWGGELLTVDNQTNEQQRLGHFLQVRMPGGEQAIEEPWRMAQSFLHALGEVEPASRSWPWLVDHGQASSMVRQLLDRDVACLLTSSCGRLFDAVSALLGLCHQVGYEGQAAIQLEAIQDTSEQGAYPCPVREKEGLIILDSLTLFAAVWDDWTNRAAPGRISRRFHLGLARGLRQWALLARDRTGLDQVALSGGVFQNETLVMAVQHELASAGLTPLFHVHLPPNDACISLGQAVFGRQQLLLQSP